MQLSETAGIVTGTSRYIPVFLPCSNSMLKKKSMGFSKVCISGDAISGRLGEIHLRCHSWRLFRPCGGELPGRTVVESVAHMDRCPKIGDFEGNTMECVSVVLGCFGVQMILLKQ